MSDPNDPYSPPPDAQPDLFRGPDADRFRAPEPDAYIAPEPPLGAEPLMR